MDKSRLLKNTQRYRETPKGVLTNIYDHMRRRNKVEFSLQEFHRKFLNDKKFLRLHKEWLKSGKDKLKKPSIDRISNKKHYTFDNIQILTWAENRHKQIMERRSRKGKVVQFLNDKPIKIFYSQRDVVKKFGVSQGNLSEHMNGKRKYCKGFIFKWLKDLTEEEIKKIKISAMSTIIPNYWRSENDNG